MSFSFIEASPCQTCPYRQDAPLGSWDPQHFVDVLRHDHPMGAMWGCHKYARKQVQSFCAGWLLDQLRRNYPSLQLRVRMLDDVFAQQVESAGVFVTRFWYIVHNLIAHPLLVTGWAWAERFHDWTAERM